MKNASKKDTIQLKQQFISLFASKKSLILLVLLCTIILLLPNILRPESQLLIGKESYYHLRFAEYLFNGNNIKYDSLVQRPIAELPVLSFCIAEFALIFKISLLTASVILPLILGILTLIIFYFIIVEFKQSIITFICSLFLIFSPPFIFIFSTLNNYSFIIPLTLLSILLILKNKYMFSVIPLLLIPLFGSLNIIFPLFVLFVYSYSQNRKYLKYLLIPSVWSLCLFLFFYIPLKLDYHVPSMLNFNPYPIILRNLVSDLGGDFGIGLFMLLLSFLGLRILWHEKYKNGYIYLIMSSLFILSLFFKSSLFYLNLFLVPLAAMGIIRLYNRNWYSKTIRNFTLFVIILGLIFSTVSYVTRLSTFSPEQETIAGLQSLKELNKDQGLVFSHYSRGFWINTLADSEALMDSRFYTLPRVNERYNDSETLFSTRDINQAKEIIDKYKIKYIFIDDEMKSGLVWSQSDEGLQFLLKNSKIFKREYSSNNTEIWSVNL